MYSLMKLSGDAKTFYSVIRCYSWSQKTHYDVLKLQKNCTDKEIKEAFIRLSKEYHPDKNKDKSAQQQFVRIVEAYNVLGKRSSRTQYDGSLNARTSYYQRPQYEAYNMRPPTSTYYGGYQKQQRQTRQNPYYSNSPQWARKVPNYFLILLCFGIAIVGTLIQVCVIREMYVANRKKAIERSMKLAEELEKVREAARTTTNEAQTRLILEKIVGSSNPTIATASLGQSLAAEKNMESENIRDIEKEEVSFNWYPTADDDIKELTVTDVKHVLRKLGYFYFSDY